MALGGVREPFFCTCVLSVGLASDDTLTLVLGGKFSQQYSSTSVDASMGGQEAAIHNRLLPGSRSATAACKLGKELFGITMVKEKGCLLLSRLGSGS